MKSANDLKADKLFIEPPADMLLLFVTEEMLILLLLLFMPEGEVMLFKFASDEVALLFPLLELFVVVDEALELLVSTTERKWRSC